jgi:hypothetical protein
MYLTELEDTRDSSIIQVRARHMGRERDGDGVDGWGLSGGKLVVYSG